MISAFRFSWVTTAGTNSFDGALKSVVSALGVSPERNRLGGRSGHDLAGLGDRVVLIAGDDELKRGDRRIVARHRRHWIDACGLEGGNCATAGAVIGGHDAEDLLAKAGDLAASPLLRLRRRPVRRVVFGQNGIAALVETGVNALLYESGGGIGRRSIDFKHALALLRRDVGGLEMLDERFGDGLANGFVVEGHVEIDLGVGDRPVIGDDLDALRLCHLDQGRCSGGVDGVEHDDLGALRDRRVELLLLPRGIGTGVLVDHLAALAELLHLCGKARIIVLFVAGRGLVRHQEGNSSVLYLGGLRVHRRGAEQREGQGQPARMFRGEAFHSDFPFQNWSDVVDPWRCVLPSRSVIECRCCAANSWTSDSCRGLPSACPRHSSRCGRPPLLFSPARPRGPYCCFARAIA